MVVLTGIVSATVSVYADGSYSYTGTASALGQVSATARDTWGLNSAAAAATLTNNAPSISNFTVINRGNGNWEFTGRVTDEFAPGMVVRLSGMHPASGGSLDEGGPPPPSNDLLVTVGADGWFSITANVGNIAGLMISANTTDGWGRAANTAYYVA